ncbi:MAG: bifunctional diaminohydroxyphosphoribosylaminopyrimidine deaminase/5-amino-6-(5-phosphoribosylamino)uracil reductase RibD [Bacteroidota bacterium]
MTEEQAMRYALKLALRGSGYVSPNPRVGAVILKDGDLIGVGWNRAYGEPHAEAEAIADAGLDDFAGCTMVVTLEPCNHTGNTPPCAQLIKEKNFSRVVVGMTDPNPNVEGGGIEVLMEAGIDVAVGVLEDECRWINRFFIKHITTGLPYVVAKVAQSLDGCIATKKGDSKWISGKESRKRSHALRAEVDAVLVGKNTALVDNPHLTTRDVEGRSPKRIVFDTHLGLPLTINAFNDTGRYNTIVCCNPQSANQHKAETLAVAGVSVLPVQQNDIGDIDITSALYELGEKHNVTSIMVEGGAKIFSSFLVSGMIDELHLFIAPIIVGNGLDVFSDFNIGRLKEAKKFDIRAVAKSDMDIHVIATRRKSEE